MKRKQLDKAVSTILSQYDEDMSWSLYCAFVANSFSNVGSFDDFLKNCKTPVEQNEQVMNGQQIRKQLDKADKLLSGFVPPAEGGN